MQYCAGMYCNVQSVHYSKKVSLNPTTVYPPLVPELITRISRWFPILDGRTVRAKAT